VCLGFRTIGVHAPHDVCKASAPLVRSVNTNGDDENIDAFSSYISIENTNDWSVSDAYQDCIKRFI